MMTSHSEMEKRIVQLEGYGQRKEQHRWWSLLRDMKELLGD